MTTQEPKSDGPAVLSSVELDACRANFVRYAIDDQAHRDPAYRASVRAHRKGKQHGFDHPAIQTRWLVYRAGWLTGRASNSGISGAKHPMD